MHETRVLIVDDSPFMCQLLKNLMSGENFVIETARNGRDAIHKVQTFCPNVITLDIEMPVMSGLEALKVIMDRHPTPIIIVSSQTLRGSEISLQALEAGAFDVVTKPRIESNTGLENFRKELITKIKIAGLTSPKKLYKAKSGQILPVLPMPKTFTPRFPPVVVIGTSTGGPPALQTVLSQIPAGFPAPILVVQHMPKGFTNMMAKRLDSCCELAVREAEDGDSVLPGKVLIAPGGMQMFVEKFGSKVVTRIVKESPITTPYRPSVNVLFDSVADVFSGHVIAVVLTGMGNDGLEACRKLKKKGAYILAESEQSCIVYGMSKSVIDAGLTDNIVSLPEMAKFLIQTVYGEKGV